MNNVEADRHLSEPRDARDLQAKLYREIGISAVAAALRFMNQPDPTMPKPTVAADMPAFLREPQKAA